MASKRAGRRGVEGIVAVEVTCQCGQLFLAPEKAGARVKCPHCGVKFALRELHEADSGDLTPLPPDDPLGQPLGEVLGAAVSGGAAPSSGLLSSPTERVKNPPQSFWLSPPGAAVIGLLASAGLIIVALAWRASIDDGAGGQSAESAQAAWREYRSEEGRFAIELPVGAEEHNGQTEVDGEQLPINSFDAFAPDGSALQIISYHTPAVENANQRRLMLDAFCEREAGERTLQSRKSISLDGRPGCELRYVETLDAMSDEVRVRIYATEGRVLKLTSRRIRRGGAGGDAEKFFESLQFLRAP